MAENLEIDGIIPQPPSAVDCTSERTDSPDQRPRYSKLDRDRDVEVSGGEERLKKMEKAFRTILECINEDPDREGLVRTPLRAAKAMMFFTKGYEDTLECTFLCYRRFCVIEFF